MSLYNQDRIRLQNSTISRFVELREHFQSGESKSVAEPIRKLKSEHAACSNCSQFKSHPPHHLMYVCKKLTSDHEGSVKFVKPYNLCADHKKRNREV